MVANIVGLLSQLLDNVLNIVSEVLGDVFTAVITEIKDLDEDLVELDAGYSIIKLLGIQV